MTEIYKLITDTITAKAAEITAAGFTPPEHMDVWNNQYNHEGEEIPYNRPAVFVEILPIKWERRNGIKRGYVEAIMHIEQETYTEDNTELLEYADFLNDMLENTRGAATTPLENIGSEPDHDHSNRFIVKQRYGCVVERWAHYKPEPVNNSYPYVYPFNYPPNIEQ